MRISKKILACVLAALMAIAMMPFTASAETIGIAPSASKLEYSVDNAEELFDSIDDADAAATIVFTKDIVVTEPVVIEAGKIIKFDLKGHSLSGNIQDEDGKKLIQVSGELEFIGDGGCIYNTNTAGQGHAACQALTGGTIFVNAPINFGDSDTDMTNANNTNRGCGIQNNGGTIIINDGYYTAIDSDYVSNPNKYAYAILNCSGDTTINNATVYGEPNGSLGCEGGTLTVNGGTYEVKSDNYYSLYAGGGDITVNGGTFINNGTKGVNYMSSGSDIEINGGDFTFSEATPFVQSSSKGSLVVSGGTFSGDVSAYCAEDYKAVYDENTGRYVIEEIAYGTIALYPAGDADITGSGTAHEKITISNTALNYAAADYSVGRYYDGYYMSGIKFVAPEGTNISQNARYTNGSVDSTTGQLKVKNLYTAQDGANFMYSWPHVTEESLKEALAAGQNKTWEYTFDWDGDGVFEQEAIIELVCDTIALVKDNEQVYPSDVEDGFSITAEDNVDLNFYLGSGDEIDHIVVTHSDPENNDGSTVTTTKAAVSLQNYGDKKVYKVELAPAQLKDTIRIAVYEDSSTIDRVIVTSVDEYCRTLIAMNDEDLGAKANELKDLARATLDYGKAASSYFEYNEDAFDGVSNELDEPDLTDGRLAVASGSNTYNIPFTGVSYVATTVPALRFTVRSDFSENYLTELNETIETNIGEAKFVKVVEDGQVKRMLQITGINICDFGKKIVVNAGGSTILTFVPITWAKSAAKITTNDRLASLGKTICNYYINSTEYFGIKA